MFLRSPISITVLLLAGVASLGWSAETDDNKPGDDKPSDTKIWNGVFTASQAERGKAAFGKFCADCHAPNLGGGAGRGPALRGESFMQDWQNGSVDALFVKLRDSMPANYPETVSEETKIDILGYLLQQNGFPAGSVELRVDESQLSDIQIVQKGNHAAPNFAVVRMVGCLGQGSDKVWTLSKSTEPVVTKDETTNPAALRTAAASALGTTTFQLLSVAAFKPDSIAGQRVEARGLLYRQPDRNLLTLTSLASAGPGCQ